MPVNKPLVAKVGLCVVAIKPRLCELPKLSSNGTEVVSLFLLRGSCGTHVNQFLLGLLELGCNVLPDGRHVVLHSAVEKCCDFLPQGRDPDPSWVEDVPRSISEKDLLSELALLSRARLVVGAAVADDVVSESQVLTLALDKIQDRSLCSLLP